ncbi:hypothetical protein E2C01_097668 [Portunus trituberculatus]|uniref:Uncharacterized protein n=1 Tax=Portunus trituberculatus TaxID=210409 RepID=A0A5B7K512_PORTR|nr:hypothetical protein [Portunus trituberculatus]
MFCGEGMLAWLGVKGKDAACGNTGIYLAALVSHQAASQRPTLTVPTVRDPVRHAQYTSRRDVEVMCAAP